MKKNRFHLPILLFLALFLSLPLVAQQEANKELHYEVNKVYHSISLTKEQVEKASNIADLNPYYKPSWIKEYVSVEIAAQHKGEYKKEIGKNSRLTAAQKELINTADVGHDFVVKVLYYPDNTLISNDVKEINFSFWVEPETEAEYPGSLSDLYQYLKEKAIAKIPDGTFVNYDLTGVKFTITEDGEISNVHLFQSSQDDEIDQLLLKTISNMPCWKPAEYGNGVKVTQDFIWTIGNMENCNVNLLNIRRER